MLLQTKILNNRICETALFVLYIYAYVCVIPGSMDTKVRQCLEDNGLYFSISPSVSSIPQLSSSLSQKAK